VPRFQYYEVIAGRVINPPIEFIKDTSTYIYGIGRAFEEEVRDRVFSALMPRLPQGWQRTPPAILTALLELFNYFGNLLPSGGQSPPMHSMEAYQEWAREQGAKARDELVRVCLDQLDKGNLPRRQLPASS
jgi:hypothetical protein